MSQANTIARPYAQAAFDEARHLGDLKGWSGVLRTLAESLCNPEVQAVVGSPRVAKNKVEELVMALCGNQLSAQQRNFIRVLVDGHRLDVVTEILVMYEALRAEAEKFAEVTVSSAFELSEAQQQKIAAALKVRMQREIKLSCKVDKNLLGGIVIRAEDKVIDGSARTRLGEMANALA
ncbi:MAG: F0F1 ATP synthase subunit delta [Nitrosomonadales bacterium]|nr:F0F1 ATP synthase subunit delta [Nitrosomonadales bacterium]